MQTDLFPFLNIAFPIVTDVYVPVLLRWLDFSRPNFMKIGLNLIKMDMLYMKVGVFKQS